MKCPACARPIAMARSQCVYCGASLSSEVLEEASAAARRVLQTKSLASLEAAAQAPHRVQVRRNYVVLDTTSASVEVIADACSISIWQARQWQAASRYRLVKVITGPDDPALVQLRERGLGPILVPEDVVARLRHPLAVDSIDVSAAPPRCSLREGPEAAPTARTLDENGIILLVSGRIRRERVQDSATQRNRSAGGLQDAWLVHLYIKGEVRPWEIDPLRTGFEGATLASANMSTLDLVRRLSAIAPYDDAFKNVVPALSVGPDPIADLAGLNPSPKRTGKEPKVLVLDNVTQFREYSAWRGAVESAQAATLQARY